MKAHVGILWILAGVSTFAAACDSRKSQPPPAPESERPKPPDSKTTKVLKGETVVHVYPSVDMKMDDKITISKGHTAEVISSFMPGGLLLEVRFIRSTDGVKTADESWYYWNPVKWGIEERVP